MYRYRVLRRRVNPGYDPDLATVTVPMPFGRGCRPKAKGRWHRLHVLAVLSLLLLACTPPLLARLRIEITQGVDGALPIAVQPFLLNGGTATVDIAQVVTEDLVRSGRFKAVAAADIPSESTEEPTDFAAWRQHGIEYLVRGELLQTGASTLAVRFRLYDTVVGRMMLGRSIPVSPEQLRPAAHMISDILYEHLTGTRGAFSTQIAYVIAVGRAADRRYRLEVADADGHQPQPVYQSDEPIMSPTWSPEGDRLAYVAFRHRRPTIQLQELRTGQTREILAKPGLNGAPAWSPDGRQLAVTLSFQGNPEIYLVELATLRLQRLTWHRAIDTEATWTADGQHILFTSDRSGSPQIYRLAVTGGEPVRLSFHGKYNADPTVLPDNDRIAIVHADKGRFRIALLDTNNAEVQLLTDGDLDESPSAAPNGSMLLYASRLADGRGVLAAVSADGRFRQRLMLTEGDVREPAWSPFRDRR